MVNNAGIVILASTVLGFLAGIGVGGGSLLMLWLTVVVGMAHQSARVINLLFFIPTAIIASLFQLKSDRLKPKKLLPAIIAGCVGAIAFSIIGKQLNTELLKQFFGVLLLITGTRELFYKPKDQSLRERKTR